jgi:hypothetical protein
VEYLAKAAANQFTEALNYGQKHVVSTTLNEPLSGQNSTLLKVVL